MAIESTLFHLFVIDFADVVRNVSHQIIPIDCRYRYMID